MNLFKSWPQANPWQSPLHNFGCAVLLVSGLTGTARAEETPAPEHPPALEVGVQHMGNNNGSVLGLTLGHGNAAFRLVGDHSKTAEHLLLSGGWTLGQDQHLIAGLSVGREPIPGHGSQMKGHSLLWSWSATRPLRGIRRWSIDGLHQRTESRTLSVTDTPFTESVSEVGGGLIRTTTTEGYLRERLWFEGGRRHELAATVEADVGDDGLFALRWLHGRTQLQDRRTRYDRLQASYRHHLPGFQANWTVGLNDRGRLQLGAEKRLEDLGAHLVLMAYKHTRDDRSHGVYLGLRFAIGPSAYNPGRRPEANAALLYDTVRALYAPQNYFGVVREDTERWVTAVHIEESAVPHAPNPTPPELSPPGEPTPPAEPETPPEPPAPPVDPAPTDIELNQTQVLMLVTTNNPLDGTLTLAAPITAGQLSCTDVALPPYTANTCTYEGGNGLITVAPDGTVTYGVGTYNTSSFVITVTATDQAGNRYTETLTLVYDIAMP